MPILTAPTSRHAPPQQRSTAGCRHDSPQPVAGRRRRPRHDHRPGPSARREQESAARVRHDLPTQGNVDGGRTGDRTEHPPRCPRPGPPRPRLLLRHNRRGDARHPPAARGVLSEARSGGRRAERASSGPEGADHRSTAGDLRSGSHPDPRPSRDDSGTHVVRSRRRSDPPPARGSRGLDAARRPDDAGGARGGARTPSRPAPSRQAGAGVAPSGRTSRVTEGVGNAGHSRVGRNACARAPGGDPHRRRSVHRARRPADRGVRRGTSSTRATITAPTRPNGGGTAPARPTSRRKDCTSPK